MTNDDKTQAEKYGLVKPPKKKTNGNPMNVFYDEKTQAEIDAAQSLLDDVCQLILDKMEREGLDPQMRQRMFLEDPVRNQIIGLICDLSANATKVTYVYDRIDPVKDKAAQALLQKHGLVSSKP